MKLFWKIFASVCFAFLVMESAIIWNDYNRNMRFAQDSLVQENRISGSFIAKEIEAGYPDSRWPFESMKKLSERKDFLFWWVVKEDGEIFLADRMEFVGTNTTAYFPGINLSLENETMILNRTQNYGLCVKPLETGKKWSFWLGFSTIQLSEISKGMVAYSTAELLLASALLGLFVYIIVAHFTTPLNKLAEGAKVVADGNLDYRLNMKSGDELEDVSSSFDLMTGRLKKSRIEIVEHNIRLEKEVKKRTSELSERLSELERFRKVTVNREIKMMELKKKVKGLEEKREERKEKKQQ